MTGTGGATRGRSDTLVVVQERGESAVLVVVRRGRSGVELVEAREVARGEVDAVVANARATRRIDVLTPERTVTRVVAMETGEQGAEPETGSLVEAARLLEESELPGGLPSCRRTSGVFRSAGGVWSAVVAGWIGEAREDEKVTQAGVRRHFAPEPVCLAYLCDLAGARVGVTRSGEGASVVCRGDERLIVRGVLLGAGGDSADRLTRVVRESAEIAGVQALDAGSAAVGSGQDPVRALALSGGDLPELLGAPRDEGWLDRFGVCGACAQIALSGDARVESLVLLAPEPPVERQSPLDRLAGFASTPRVAAGLVLVSVLAMFVVPYVAARARLAELESLVGRADRMQEANTAAARRAVFYELLRDRRWPMTKLLADVAGSAPVGITVRNVELVHGEGLTIRGTSESPELVTTFRTNLSSMGVFTNVSTPSQDGGEFQLEADVFNALYRGERADDFGEMPLAVRLHGEEARGEYTPALPAEAEVAGGGPRVGGGRGGSEDRPGLAGRGGGGSGADGGAGTPAPVPEPLTDAQIRGMDRQTAMREFGVRRKAASRTDISDEDRRRLEQEAERCRQQMRDAGGGA